jgi:ankyrin repeat protein
MIEQEIEIPGWTPLHCAARIGDLDAVKNILRDNPKSLNIKTHNGWSALKFACVNKHFEVAQYLLEKKAKIDPDALHGAAEMGYLQLVKLLMIYGMKKSDEKNKQGDTPFHSAARAGKLDCVKFLVACGVPIDQKNNEGYTALHLASEEQCFTVMDWLADHGADVTLETNEGKTATSLVAKAWCHTFHYKNHKNTEPTLQQLRENLKRFNF